MLLTIDIGNTNVVIGGYEGSSLKVHWRIATKSGMTVDECGIMLMNLFSYSEYKPGEVDGVITASVVPSLTDVFLDMSERFFGLAPLVVGHGLKTGMPILTDNPKEVGADRIVNAVAAFEKYGGSTIIIDFGTATTFDCVSGKGEYMGGSIAPGIDISLDALYHKAAKLPRVEMHKPKRALGKNTVESIQSGIFYGYLGLVRGILDGLKREVGNLPTVIATGGIGRTILTDGKMVDVFDEFLTMDGLRILYERNR